MRLEHMLLAFFLSAFGITAECSSSQPGVPKNQDQLAGCWYGEDFQPVFQRRASWLMNRKPDGSFTIEFRSIEKDVQLPVQTEEGRWSYSAGKYITITTRVADEAVDPSDPKYTDEYQIKMVGDSEMVYFHSRAKQTFRSRRVVCDYKAP